MPTQIEAALEAAEPFITRQNAEAYDNQTDKMLWVEENIMDPAGINFTICSNIGSQICEAIEDRLDVILYFVDRAA
jgi:hypothetical protein